MKGNSHLKNRISFLGAVSIGIGGMIGAGIFSILGVVAQAAGSAMWLSFLIGGFIILFSTYSYAKLGAKYPSTGGAVEFLVQGWGKGVMSGGINVFMWIGYIISIALYAQGFAAYCQTFFTNTASSFMTKTISISIVLLFAFINMLGASSVGKSELIIVIIKVSILILFAAVGMFYIHPDYLAIATWPSSQSILFGTGILFIGYEGFGLITNAAGDMLNPHQNLPRALYLSVFIVIAIYLAVSITVIGNLSPHQIFIAGDYALAAAAKPFLGSMGFKLISIAALFSTASAINATLFGAANVSYMIARDGELSPFFSRTEWRGATEGLLITTALVIIFILFFNLAGVTMMGSSAFLLIYAAVNAGHLKILSNTGANLLLVLIGCLLCIAMFCLLEIYTYQHAPAAVYTMIVLLGGSFLLERFFYFRRVLSL